MPKFSYMSDLQYEQSAQLLTRAKKVLAGGVSSEFRKYNHPHALFYTHGKGSRIYDVDGNEYLDFTLSQGPLIVGHSHPYVLNAVTDYSQHGQLFAGQHIREVELGEKLQKLIPCAELMRFCLDGSEAIQTALRVARAKTGRKKFLRFEGHYHGWLDNVAWGISAPDVAALGSLQHPSVFPWSRGLPSQGADEFIVLPWNDPDLLEQTIQERYEEIAAVITEPVMCNSSCIQPAGGYLHRMRDLCNKFGIALIFDEVITGFRLSLGGAQQYYSIVPDMAIFAKALANGYPISAVTGKREWMQLIGDGKVIHAGTMNSGNPSVAAALATIEVLEQEQPYERMFYLGRKLMNGLKKSAQKNGVPLMVQGPGPMFHTGFTHFTEVKDFRDTFSYDKIKLSNFIAAMQNNNLRIIGRGLWYISAVHTEEDIDQAIHIAEKVLAAL